MATYSNVDSIKVSPGIGLARVGNSDDYFIGPETPNVVPDPGDGQYKDASGALKRQAQRFRVFALDASGNMLGEVTGGDTVNGSIVEIQWTVHLANMKSANYCFQGQYGFDPLQLRNSTLQRDMPPRERDQLIIDPGPMTIQGTSQGPVELVDTDGDGSTIFNVPADNYTLKGLLQFDPPQNVGPTDDVPVTYTPATMVSLGRLYTDSSGRLIVAGAEGRAGSTTTPAVVISKITQQIPNPDPNGKSPMIPDPNPEYNGNSYFNNPGWFDDTAGGSIDAQLFVSGTTTPIDNGSSQPLTTAGNVERTGWLAVAPPKYAPASYTVVSLLDLQLDLFPQQDPYTGAGPIYYAVIGSDGQPYISSSSDGTSFNFEPLPGPLVLPHSEHSPAVAVFGGKVYYAVTAQAGAEFTGRGTYLSSSSDGKTFSEFKIVSAGRSNQAPALTVFQGQLFYAVIGTDNLPYISGSTDGTSFSFEKLSGPSALPVTEVAPAVTAFNGTLYYALITSDDPGSGFFANSIYLATSSDGETFSDFEPSGGNTYQAPALAVFQGQLFYGVIGTNGLPFLAASTDGKTFDFKQLQGPSALPKTEQAPALSAFNGRLYYAVTALGGDGFTVNGTYIASSSDGVTFSDFMYVSPGLTPQGPSLATSEPVEFFRDIYPILKLVTDYAWTNQLAFNGHAPGSNGNFLREPYLSLLAAPAVEHSSNPVNSQSAREFVFNFIRPPAEVASPSVPPPPQKAPRGVSTGEPQRGDLMPKLYGNGGSPAENDVNGTTFPNQWLSLTNHQLSKFQRWVNGDFMTGTLGDERWSDLPADQALDFAALQPTIGGGFHPGIELTYMMGAAAYFAAAFRFTDEIQLPNGKPSPIVPGSVAGYMSVPWQGDFWSCNTSWWPPQRPDVVVEVGDQKPPKLRAIPWFRGTTIPPAADGISNYLDGYQTMADDWPRFGLVTPVAGKTIYGEQVFQETERDKSLDRPSILGSYSGGQFNTDVLKNYPPNFPDATVGGGGTDSGEQAWWFLVPYSASPDYFFIVSISDGVVLTAGEGEGAIATLTTKASPAEDAQLWRYLPTGVPGVFQLASKLNSLRLAASDAKAVTQEPNGTGLSKWVLLAPTSS